MVELSAIVAALKLKLFTAVMSFKRAQRSALLVTILIHHAVRLSVMQKVKQQNRSRKLLMLEKLKM